MDEEEQQRARLGLRVRQARRSRFGTVDAARIAAGVSTTTWNKVENGERVRDDRLVAVERALGWMAGDAWRVMEGGEPGADDGDEGLEELVRRVTRAPFLSDREKAAMLALLGRKHGVDSA